MTVIPSFMRRNGRDEEAMDLDEPMLPQFDHMPASQDPRRRHWTAKVMEAGQYVEELEAKVAAQAEEIGIQRNQIRLFEEAQRLLRRQLGDFQTENGKLRDALSRTQTKLEVSGQLVLQALDELRTWKLAEPEPPAIAEEQPAGVA
jgi:predicted RNase H-like nuclease (RuvC/YqgF family)